MRLDLQVDRNGTYNQRWRLRDTDGAPINLTSIALELKVRAVAGQGAVLASATIDKYDPTNGMFTVRIEGSAFAAVEGATEIVRLAYDMRMTYPDGVKYIPAAGQVILTPGATY